MALRDGSRYLLAQIVEQRGSLTGKPTRPPFVDLRMRVTKTATDDTVFIPDGSSSWPSLAVKYLRDAKAWWVIADLSLVIDPFEELVPGDRYRCASLTRYQFSIRPGEQGA